MELSLVFKEINRIKKGTKEVMTLGAITHPVEFPIYEKELKKNLELVVVVHVFLALQRQRQEDL